MRRLTRLRVDWMSELLASSSCMSGLFLRFTAVGAAVIALPTLGRNSCLCGLRNSCCGQNPTEGHHRCLVRPSVTRSSGTFSGHSVTGPVGDRQEVQERGPTTPSKAEHRDVRELMDVRVATEKAGVLSVRGRLCVSPDRIYERLKEVASGAIVPLIQQDEQFDAIPH